MEKCYLFCMSAVCAVKALKEADGSPQVDGERRCVCVCVCNVE